jgi:hypothetical protein
MTCNAVANLEIREQIRLSSLQREPVLFLRDHEGKVIKSFLGKGGLFYNTRGPATGVVLLHPSSTADVVDADWPSNLPVLVVPTREEDVDSWTAAVPARKVTIHADEWKKEGDLIKAVENWIRNQGL